MTHPRDVPDVAAGPVPSIRQLSHDFLAFEEELGLFQQTIAGVFFWEYVRHHIILELQRRLELAAFDPFSRRKSLGQYLSLIGSSLSSLFWRNPFFTTRKPLLFFCAPARMRESDGTWWDTAVDPLLDSLPCSYYYLERHHGNGHRSPPHTRHIKHRDLLSMISFVYRTIVGKWHFAPEELRLLRHIQAEMDSRFGTTVDVVEMTSAILRSRTCLLPLYRRILQQVAPEAVFFTSINYPEKVAIEACKERGILTVELQHGVIGPQDFGYMFPPGVSVRCFADYLLVFGQYWKECVRFPIAAERVVPIGSPYLEARQRQYAQVSKRDQIVIISQPTIGAELSRFAVQLAHCEGLHSRIVYRLHPNEREWQTRYPWLRDAGIDISEAQHGMLHPLLAESRAQVGVYSAAIFEGLAYGLKTYLVDLPGLEYMDILIEKGIAQRIHSPEQIVHDRAPQTAIDSSTLYRNDSLAHFRAFLERILQGRLPHPSRAQRRAA